MLNKTYYSTKKFCKQVRKSFKNEGNMKNMGPRANSMMSMELTFEECNGTLVAYCGEYKYTLTNGAHHEVKAGQTWKCFATMDDLTGIPTAFPTKLVSEAAEPDDATAMEEIVTDIPDTPENIEEGIGIDAPEVPEIFAEDPTSEIEETTAVPEENVTGNTKQTIRNLTAENEKLTKENEKLKEELIRYQKTNKELSTQVNSLNSKNSTLNVMSNESKIQSQEEKIESLELEVRLLREELQSRDIDDLAVVARHPVVPKATLTGPSTICCTVLKDGPHTILVSPRLKSIRIIPDPNGKVKCTDRTIRISCISGFSNYSSVRPLDIKMEDDVVNIRL